MNREKRESLRTGKPIVYEHQHAWTEGDGRAHGAELALPASFVDDPEPFGYGVARSHSRIGRSHNEREDYTDV